MDHVTPHGRCVDPRMATIASSLNARRSTSSVVAKLVSDDCNTGLARTVSVADSSALMNGARALRNAVMSDATVIGLEAVRRRREP